MTALMIADTEFSYDFTQIADMAVELTTDEKTGKAVATGIRVKDEVMEPTQRFWTSLFATFGFNKAFFKYFDHHEVFNRISEVDKNDRLRVCVERTHHVVTGQPVNRILGISRPEKPLLDFEDLMEKLNLHGALSVQYADGIVESFHQPRVGSTEFDIGGDLFNNRFVMATPIDGYGSPNVYLSLLRRVCSNGAVAYAKAFRSSIAMGKGNDNTDFSITRVLDQFSNDEGYSALRSRFQSATTSWASVYETTSLYKLLVKLLNREDVVDGGGALESSYDRLHSTDFLRRMLDKSTAQSENPELGSPVLRAFHSMTGDTSQLYGLANLDALSVKRQRTLPTRASVYDMINFATELATHHSDVPSSRHLQAWVGTLISNEYDMEGTMDQYKDFADFHMVSKLQAGVTGSEHQHN